MRIAAVMAISGEDTMVNTKTVFSSSTMIAEAGPPERFMKCRTSHAIGRMIRHSTPARNSTCRT